jgi:hypothetical protein
MDVAYKVGYIVNIELLRGAKRLQQNRTLAVSLADACKRGVLAQVKRIVELNKFDPQTRVPADGYWSLCTAAEYNQVECARYLIVEVRLFSVLLAFSDWSSVAANIAASRCFSSTILR